jgi:DNA modification methylase
MENIQLFNEDCLGDKGLCTISDKSIDMILCDPPFGITANKWDKALDLEKMFKEYDRIIKDNGAIVLFGNQPFTTDVINAYRKNFRYSLVWDKNCGTDFFNCNKKPLKSHEDIIVFYKKSPTYNPQKEEGTPYIDKRNGTLLPMSNVGGEWVRRTIVNEGTRFPKSVIKVDYTEADEYEMEEHEDIIVFYKKQPTYNPQMEEGGKPYKGKKEGTVAVKCEGFGDWKKNYKVQKQNINEGTRFPKTVLKFKRETGKHTTQKPVKLCEWLIKTYTNEGETVLDNTCGSGTTGVACKNTGRKFIGYEMTEQYYKVALERIGVSA